MAEKETPQNRWRGLPRRRRSGPWVVVAALVVALAAIGTALAPWLLGPGLILTIQLALVALVVYVAVRLALTRRQQ